MEVLEKVKSLNFIYNLIVLLLLIFLTYKVYQLEEDVDDAMSIAEQSSYEAEEAKTIAEAAMNEAEEATRY